MFCWIRKKLSGFKAPKRILLNFYFTCLLILCVKFECCKICYNFIYPEIAKLDSEKWKNCALIHKTFLVGLAPVSPKTH